MFTRCKYQSEFSSFFLTFFILSKKKRSWKLRIRRFRIGCWIWWQVTNKVCNQNLIFWREFVVTCNMWLKCFSLTKFILYQPLKVVVHTVWAPLKPTVCILFIHILKSKNVFSRDFFLKILALCMVSIQKRFLIKSGL